MRILVTNDDGPPDAVASPYIQAFVETLIEAGHSLTIVVPDQQRSWIGKAHFAHEATTAKAVSLPFYNHKTEKIESHEWILCSGTPATCAQIGLGYYHPEGPEGPKGFGMGFDLVISGPNYGRNCTAALATSSGTIGGAMEAAMCGKRAVALSFAFPLTRIHNPKHIRSACRASVAAIERLCGHWDPAVELYTLNVLVGHPSMDVPGGTNVVYTNMLGNKWQMGPCIVETTGQRNSEKETVNVSTDGSMTVEQAQSGAVGGTGAVNGHTVTGNGHAYANGNGSHNANVRSRPKVRTFQWKHNMADVHRSIDEAGPGTDGWELREGCITVTGLRANFEHARLRSGTADFTV